MTVDLSHNLVLTVSSVGTYKILFISIHGSYRALMTDLKGVHVEKLCPLNNGFCSVITTSMWFL